jgi:hypothetical protein
MDGSGRIDAQKVAALRHSTFRVHESPGFPRVSDAAALQRELSLCSSVRAPGP